MSFWLQAKCSWSKAVISLLRNSGGTTRFPSLNSSSSYITLAFRQRKYKLEVAELRHRVVRLQSVRRDYRAQIVVALRRYRVHLVCVRLLLALYVRHLKQVLLALQ